MQARSRWSDSHQLTLPAIRPGEAVSATIAETCTQGLGDVDVHEVKTDDTRNLASSPGTREVPRRQFRPDAQPRAGRYELSIDHAQRRGRSLIFCTARRNSGEQQVRRRKSANPSSLPLANTPRTSGFPHPGLAHIGRRSARTVLFFYRSLGRRKIEPRMRSHKGTT